MSEQVQEAPPEVPEVNPAECPRGHENPVGAAFCADCGANISGTKIGPVSLAESLSGFKHNLAGQAEDFKRKNASWPIIVGVVVVLFIGLAILVGVVAHNHNKPVGDPGGYTGPTVVMTARQLEHEIETNSSWTDGTTAITASCVESSVVADGSGDYKCQIGFSDGITKLQVVTVGTDGNWLTG